MNDHPVLKKLADSHEQKLRAADEKIINCLTAKEKRAELKKEAAERLKQFRNAYKMSQNQLAKQIGYTRAHISAIEKGLDRPSKQMADKIENEFGISANWLLYGTAA